MRTGVAALVCALLLCLLVPSHAIIFDLGDAGEKCFGVDLMVSTYLVGSVTVVGGPHHYSIKKTLYTPEHPVHSEFLVTATHTFAHLINTTGKHHFCLQAKNVQEERGDHTSVAIDLQMDVRIAPLERLFLDVKPIENALITIDEQVNMLKQRTEQETEYRLSQERVSGKFKSYLAAMSLVCIAALVGLSIAQAYYVHLVLKRTKWID